MVVTANLEGNKALGDAVARDAAFVESLNLPADYRYEFLGRAKVMGESNQNFLIAFLTSFLFMYMILAAQFESFVHPITILLALPLTLPFALISLILLRTNLNLYAMFGLFMLFGIVKKNGILQVDFTNVLRHRGVPKDEAILEANHTRLRPILMTTVMLIAAMIPIALGRGPGAASPGEPGQGDPRRPDAVAAADAAGHARGLFALGGPEQPSPSECSPVSAAANRRSRSSWRKKQRRGPRKRNCWKMSRRPILAAGRRVAYDPMASWRAGLLTASFTATAARIIHISVTA